MTTVKIKYRPSTVDGRQGVIYYQIIHNRKTRQLTTNYTLHANEWNIHLADVILPKSDDSRKCYLIEISNKIEADISHMHKIIDKLRKSGEKFTADDVIGQFTTNRNANYLFLFADDIIAHLKQLGKIRTSETYATALSSFKRFCNNKDLPLDDIDSDLIEAYETYLKNRGISSNSSSFYMRNLRAVYNRAVEKNLTSQRFPFKHVYTGVDKTVKRAVSLKTIKKIKEMDLSQHPLIDFSRNMFLFSFYTRGMSFIDMAYLKKKDLNNGILSYRRRKTGQQLFIRWEKCMQDIVDKYDTSQSIYLLPILKQSCNIEERKQYIYASHNINHHLKVIGKELRLSIPLTMYVARHAWASIAKSKNIPLSIISEGLGHDSEATTRIYLATLDTVAIDKANSIILKSL